MIRLELFYQLLSLFLAYTAFRNLRQRNWAPAAFWFMVAGLFALGEPILAERKAGNPLPAQMAGLAVLALAGLAPWMRRAHVHEAENVSRQEKARRLGHWLFVPALLIPVVTVLLVMSGKYLQFGDFSLFSSGSITLMALALACVLALFAALRVTGERLPVAAAEGQRLLDMMGWAALLPLVLATLGGLFAASGIGEAVAAVVISVIPADSRLACVLAYGLGMVLFTMVMGNAFAAFPVMMAGIGLPLLIQSHGANAAILGSLGMLTGYCGTLLTPMAANFNLVPAALLDLDNPYGVIRAQVATALPLLLANLALMYWLVFAFS